jgi:hypothetical protein
VKAARARRYKLPDQSDNGSISRDQCPAPPPNRSVGICAAAAPDEAAVRRANRRAVKRDIVKPPGMSAPRACNGPVAPSLHRQPARDDAFINWLCSQSWGSAGRVSSPHPPLASDQAEEDH